MAKPMTSKASVDIIDGSPSPDCMYRPWWVPSTRSPPANARLCTWSPIMLPSMFMSDVMSLMELSAFMFIVL